MSSNRELVRDGLATLLATALAGTGGLAQAVYNYRIGDLAGASPVVTVSSRGVLRKRGTFGGDQAAVLLQVDVFVLYSDGASWGEDEAEDRLDAIEKEIAGVLDANQQTAAWVSIAQTEPSARVDVVIGGVDYIREVFVIGAEVWG
jgi:hypothetical protein